MNFLDFFDVYNIEHLKAYKHLTQNGSWHEGFLPEDCKMSPIWAYQIAEKMSIAYVEKVLFEDG